MMTNNITFRNATIRNSVTTFEAKNAPGTIASFYWLCLCAKETVCHLAAQNQFDLSLIWDWADLGVQAISLRCVP